MQRSSVDLPEPLGPTMHTVSPASTVMLTSSSTRSFPKLFTRLRTCSTGVPVLLSSGIGDGVLSHPSHLGHPFEAVHHPLDGVA